MACLQRGLGGQAACTGVVACIAYADRPLAEGGEGDGRWGDGNHCYLISYLIDLPFIYIKYLTLYVKYITSYHA